MKTITLLFFAICLGVGNLAIAKQEKVHRKIASPGKAEYAETDFSSEGGQGTLRVSGTEAKKLYEFLNIKPKEAGWYDKGGKVAAWEKKFPGGSCTNDIGNSAYLCDFYFSQEGSRVDLK